MLPLPYFALTVFEADNYSLQKFNSQAPIPLWLRPGYHFWHSKPPNPAILAVSLNLSFGILYSAFDFPFHCKSWILTSVFPGKFFLPPPDKIPHFPAQPAIITCPAGFYDYLLEPLNSFCYNPVNNWGTKLWGAKWEEGLRNQQSAKRYFPPFYSRLFWPDTLILVFLLLLLLVDWQLQHRILFILQNLSISVSTTLKSETYVSLLL